MGTNPMRCRQLAFLLFWFQVLVHPNFINMELGPRGLRAFWMQAPMLAVHFSGACGKTIAPAELLSDISMNSDSIMDQH